MNETTAQHDPHELSKIYARLNKQDIEQFYAGYQWWNLQQRSASLQVQVESVQREITENTELMQLVHPSAIAIATMARLQASGVNDIDLLDRMLERGEDWLDRTMQRLDYCAQLDFIVDDYTQWCQNALEGAFDWIDSMREGGTSSSEFPTSYTSIEATEELLLQKLTSEEEEQLPSSETTLRSPIYRAPASAPEQPASTHEEPAEQSGGPSVGPRFIAPPAIEEPAPVEETSPSLAEAISESQEEQPSQVSQVSQVSQPVEIRPASDTPVEATPTSDISTEQSDLQEQSSLLEITLRLPALSPSVAGDPVPEATPVTTEPPPIEASSISGTDSEQPVMQEYNESPPAEMDAVSESDQLISHTEFDPTPEELPPVAGDDRPDFEQFPVQEHSEGDLAAAEPLFTTGESPLYWEESLPYRMYPPDRQPGGQVTGPENVEQNTDVTMPQRRRDFLQRLMAKIWRR